MEHPHPTASPDGAEGFYWPVGRQEVYAVRDAFFAGLGRVLAQGLERGQGGARELMLVMPHLVLDCLSVFQAGAFVARSRRDGRAVRVPENSRLVGALSRGERPAEPAFLQQLREAFPARDPVESFRKFLRSIPKFFQRGAAPAAPQAQDAPRPAADEGRRIPSGRMTRACLSRAIVTTKKDRIISRHAEQESAPVVFLRHKDWFKAVSRAEERKAGRALSPELLRAVMDVFAESCASGGYVPEEPVPAYFEELCRRAAALVAAHLGRLRGRPGRLPRRLWTGSGANMWDRMLGQAVRENGGTFTAHSHAGGSEYELFLIHYTNEMSVCDEYVVYTERQARLIQEKLGQARLFGPAPRIFSVAAGLPAQTPRPAAAGSARPTLMYIDGGYEGEWVHVSPSFPDAVLSDWQLRLFARLAGAGWRVLYKPHPEFSPPAGVFEGVVEVVHERFEAVLDQADLFLFDYTNTSTFNVALRSGRPMALVDFGGTRWYGDALELLRKRCVVVPGGFDAENRAQVDWEVLFAGLEQARTMPPDAGFVEYFLT